MAPPRPMAAGEEVETCLSWPYPAFANKVVYSARIYTTAGLHHSNVTAKPELTAATKGIGGSPKTWSAMPGNVIIWVWFMEW